MLVWKKSIFFGEVPPYLTLLPTLFLSYATSPQGFEKLRGWAQKFKDLCSPKIWKRLYRILSNRSTGASIFQPPSEDPFYP
jgi:hypothetical protein